MERREVDDHGAVSAMAKAAASGWARSPLAPSPIPRKRSCGRRAAYLPAAEQCKECPVPELLGTHDATLEGRETLSLRADQDAVQLPGGIGQPERGLARQHRPAVINVAASLELKILKVVRVRRIECVEGVLPRRGIVFL